jgi:PilZ domain
MFDIWEAKRLDPRISLVVPVVIEGEDLSNNPFREETITENVSKTGACIVVQRQIKLGTFITVIAFEGKFRSQAIVKGIWIDDRDKKTKIGVQFSGSLQNWVLS